MNVKVECGELLLVLVQITLVLLKLFGAIDWPWWLVFAPMLGTAAIMTLLIGMGIFAVLVWRDDEDHNS